MSNIVKRIVVWQEESLVEAMLLQWWTSFNISCIFYSITSLPEIYLVLSCLVAGLAYMFPLDSDMQTLQVEYI